MGIPMLKIRRPLGRLIFNMGIAIPGKTVFLIETAPRIFKHSKSTPRSWIFKLINVDIEMKPNLCIELENYATRVVYNKK